MSYRFWHDHLGADESAIGKSLSVDGSIFTVLAVMPADFLGASPLLFPADIWMPVSAARKVAPELAGNGLERRDLTMFFLVGRLRPGVPRPRAEAELNAVAEQVDREIVEQHDACPRNTPASRDSRAAVVGREPRPPGSPVATREHFDIPCRRYPRLLGLRYG